MEVRVDTAFASFARRFEWAKSEWGKAVWELEKGNVSNSRTKRVRCLEERYGIDIERECGFAYLEELCEEENRGAGHREVGRGRERAVVIEVFRTE